MLGFIADLTKLIRGKMPPTTEDPDEAVMDEGSGTTLPLTSVLSTLSAIVILIMMGKVA